MKRLALIFILMSVASCSTQKRVHRLERQNYYLKKAVQSRKEEYNNLMGKVIRLEYMSAQTEAYRKSFDALEEAFKKMGAATSKGLEASYKGYMMNKRKLDLLLMRIEKIEKNLYH